MKRDRRYAPVGPNLTGGYRLRAPTDLGEHRSGNHNLAAEPGEDPIRSREISGEALTTQVSATGSFAGKIFLIDLVGGDAVARENIEEF